MVVDIGYMPEMSLATTAPSEHPQGEPRKHIIKPRHVDTSNMVWTEEISKEEALSNLEVRFYAFKQVSGLWVIMSSTFRVGRHAVLAWVVCPPIYLFICSSIGLSILAKSCPLCNLTLNAPIATTVVCFSRLLKCLRSLYGKQCGPRSDCSYWSSLFWVHAVCFYT